MIDMQQGSPEWFHERNGKVTASRVHAIYVGRKGAENYAAELVQERLTGKRAETYVSEAMRWGTQTENQARQAYVRNTAMQVRAVGFVPHPTIAQAGASPDGLVGLDGLLEIKCPSTAVHLDTMERRRVPKRYYSQIQWQLACTMRRWVDFVSYDPRLVVARQLYIERVPYDRQYVEVLNERVEHFLVRVERLYWQAVDKSKYKSFGSKSVEQRGRSFCTRTVIT